MNEKYAAITCPGCNINLHNICWECAAALAQLGGVLHPNERSWTENVAGKIITALLKWATKLNSFVFDYLSLYDWFMLIYRNQIIMA